MPNAPWSDCDQAVERIGELRGPEYGRLWQAELQRYREKKYHAGYLPVRGGNSRAGAEDAIRLARGLRAARRRLGWTQERLAQRAGVARLTVSRLETGQRASPEMWFRLAGTLGLTVIALAGDGERVHDGY